jgi:hypothetical protein
MYGDGKEDQTNIETHTQIISLTYKYITVKLNRHASCPLLLARLCSRDASQESQETVSCAPNRCYVSTCISYSRCAGLGSNPRCCVVLMMQNEIGKVNAK